LAAGRGELQIALGAGDLPEQIRAARNAAPIMDRERSSALEQSADADLVLRGHRLAFVRSREAEGLSAYGHRGRELPDLPQAVTQCVRRVAARDRPHRRAVFLAVQVLCGRI